MKKADPKSSPSLFADGGAALYAQVVLPLPLDQPYTYRVPEEWAEDVREGCRVLVPFGPRKLTGVVVGVSRDAGGLEQVRPIADLLDEEPSLTPELMRLTRWIAEYYVCGWGEAVKAALPTGTDIETRYVITRGEAAADSADAAERPVLGYLDAHPESTLGGLRVQFRGLAMATLRRMERRGLVRIESATGTAKTGIRYEKHVRGAAASGGAGEALRGAKQVALWASMEQFIAEGLPEPRQKDLLARAGASAATLKTLVSRGVLEVFERESARLPYTPGAATGTAAPSHVPHQGQERALAPIIEALDEGAYHTFLLHGVTGSGKTEVYIAALKHVLAKGKTGIILVPEIALTPQTVQRFQAHFGDEIAVLHSRMSLGERFDAWRLLREGRFSVVIGPRSAILAPLSNIGLIVVDEEHEGSYKQFDPAPRYHARDVAVVRARMNSAVCVLGSATPSIESYINATTGKYALLTMPDRVPVAGRSAAPLPPVEVVDLTLEKRKHQLQGTLSNRLRSAIGERLEKGEQTILLQNRRGYAPVIECKTCGWSPACRDCSVTMTYHKARRHLRCHYCGRTQRVPAACPECGAADLDLLGVGTQRVEEELAAVFPAARLLRMDLDTTGRKDAHHKLLAQFGRGEADILIGTQMVAKGLDFPRVTLVGVINADTGMLLPDFRAEERTFQLLTQVAGRAGRADLRGEVILQTRNPKNPVLRFAREHDYLGYIETALPDRRRLSYPPFGRVAAVGFQGPDEGTVRAFAERWTSLLREHTGDLVVLGPEAAFVNKVKRQFRYGTFVKSSQGSGYAVQHALRETARQFGSVPSGCRLSFDVDAVGVY